MDSKELRYKELAKKLEKFYDLIIKKSESNLYDFHRTRDIDKNAWIFVESLLKQDGWLGKSKIGDKANTALFIIVQRQSLNIRERWIEELKKSVDKFESPSEFLRMMEDRIQLDLGKSQIYGTQFVQNHNSKYFNVKSKFKNTKDMNKFASKLIGESFSNILNFNNFILKESSYDDAKINLNNCKVYKICDDFNGHYRYFLIDSENVIKGFIRLAKIYNKPVFRIAAVFANHGYGTIMYEIAMTDIYPNSIKKDFLQSEDAKKVWSRFISRNDVENNDELLSFNGLKLNIKTIPKMTKDMENYENEMYLKESSILYESKNNILETEKFKNWFINYKLISENNILKFSEFLTESNQSFIMAIHITTKEIAEKIKLEGFVPKSLIDFKYFSELGKNGIYFYDNIRLVQQYAYFLKSKTNSELVMIKVKISSDIIEKTSNQEDGLFVSSENLKYVEIKNFETIKRISDLY